MLSSSVHISDKIPFVIRSESTIVTLEFKSSLFMETKLVTFQCNLIGCFETTFITRMPNSFMYGKCVFLKSASIGEVLTTDCTLES